MVQSGKVSFLVGAILFSALLNDSITHARRDIFLSGDSEEAIIHKKQPSDEEISKNAVALIENHFKEIERKTLSHDSLTRLKCKTKDTGNKRQVTGANNSARKCLGGKREDMRISSDLILSPNPPRNTIDRQIPFTSDYRSIANHPPRHN